MLTRETINEHYGRTTMTYHYHVLIGLSAFPELVDTATFETRVEAEEYIEKFLSDVGLKKRIAKPAYVVAGKASVFLGIYKCNNHGCEPKRG